MTQIQLVQVECGDYEWLYHIGELYDAGHSLNCMSYLSLINDYGHELNGLYAIYEVTDEYVDSCGGELPFKFEDIPMIELSVLVGGF